MKNSENTEILNSTYATDKNTRPDIINEIFYTIQKSSAHLKINKNELLLIIDEALTNAMEHGNKWDPGKKIKVLINKSDTKLNISIEDEGTGFDTRALKKQLSEPDLLDIRGRGIQIIRQFCIVHWNEKGNRIEMQLELKE